jgi:hypothetical protein
MAVRGRKVQPSQHFSGRVVCQAQA